MWRTCNLPALFGVAASSAFLRPWIMIDIQFLEVVFRKEVDRSTNNARGIVFLAAGLRS